MLDFELAALNPWGILLAILAGQAVSTIWFVVLFGDPWAREYGAPSRKEHTAAVPGYTYAVGLLCTAMLVLSLALLQHALGVDTLAGARSTSRSSSASASASPPASRDRRFSGAGGWR